MPALATHVTRRFRAMGSDAVAVVRAPEPEALLDEAVALVAELEASWSRFAAASDLSRVNADPRGVVPAPPLLLRAIAAALDAARASGGLVDPTLAAALIAHGYDRSFDALDPRGVEAVPSQAPATGTWRDVHVDLLAGTVTRPPGVQLDLGGIGKGLAADLVVARLADRAEHVVVSLGGDLAVGGADADAVAQPVEVLAPDGSPLETLVVRRGGAATSGVTRRTWRTADGRSAHHLLDPRTGAPAQTGVLQVTALAPTAAEAERRAKHALLAGADDLTDILGRHGGLAVLADGTTLRREATT